MMIHGREAGDKDLTDGIDILETKRRLVELAVGNLRINHLVNRLGDGLFGEVLQTARTGFDGIGHHEDSRLFGGRFGSRIAEERLIYFLIRMRVAIGVIEIAHEGGTMMGSDEINDDFRQMMLARQTFSFRHMRHDDLRCIPRVQFQKRVL